MAKIPSLTNYDLPGTIKEGWYHVTIEDVADTPSKSQKPMITIKFSIDGIGEQFTMWYVLEDKDGNPMDFNYRKLKELSVALGLGGDGDCDLEAGGKCGARLYMEGDFVRTGKYVDPVDPELTVEWLNEDDDLPF